MKIYTLSLLSVTAVSLVSLVGLFTLSMNELRLHSLAILFVSFAVGALLGDAFIHLIPESFTIDSSLPPLVWSLLILGGMMLFFLVEKLLRHRYGIFCVEVKKPELAVINILGDAIHNFIDGVLIGASYLVSPALGISTTIAVFLHEVPQEFGDFGILIHSGLNVRKAVFINLASGAVAIFGTIITLIVGSVVQKTIVATLIPITAGGFIYIA
ncbi:MAG: hypothetical protein ACD_73C00645G0001, partial [uncultured bacterium]